MVHVNQISGRGSVRACVRAYVAHGHTVCAFFSSRFVLLVVLCFFSFCDFLVADFLRDCFLACQCSITFVFAVVCGLSTLLLYIYVGVDVTSRGHIICRLFPWQLFACQLMACLFIAEHIAFPNLINLCRHTVHDPLFGATNTNRSDCVHIVLDIVRRL